MKCLNISILTIKAQNRPSHQHKLQVHQPQSNDSVRGLQSNSFYHRVPPIWNNLPKDVVEVEKISAFKRALDKYWENDPCKFDHLHHGTQSATED